MLFSDIIETTPQTGEPLTEQTFLDLLVSIWPKNPEPLTIQIHPEMWRLKIEPWRRKNRALKALGLNWNEPKARQIHVRPRPYLTA